MHEFTELEKKWLRYKLKKWLWLIVLLSVLSILAIAIIVFMTLKFAAPSADKMTKEIAVKPPKQIEHTIQDEHNSSDSNTSNIQKQTLKKELTQNVQKVQRVLLQSHEPIITLMQKEQNESSQKQTLQRKLPPQESLQQSDAKEKVPQEEKIDINKSKDITFAKSENSFDINEVEKKFDRSGDIKYAKTLANYYYDNQNYNRSSKWAYTMNQLDPSDEEGWLLFAKSLYRLDKKEDSVKVLQSYLRHYDSQQARTLLKDIIQGEF